MERLNRLVEHNVIILTAGLTGSSVVAGLLHQAGYWVGLDTAKKPDYDTFENRALVVLNDRLLAETGHRERFDLVFRREHIDDVIARSVGIQLAPYREFVEACNLHQPWVWKDPRLWLTIRFWAKLLDFDRIRIILVSREPAQVWVSHILRRQIQTPRYLRQYMEGIRASLLEFAADNHLLHMEILYEDLLLAPERTLTRLTEFLGAEISLPDLAHCCRGPLYRRGHGVLDFLHAGLVYLANYADRTRTD